MITSHRSRRIDNISSTGNIENVAYIFLRGGATNENSTTGERNTSVNSSRKGRKKRSSSTTKSKNSGNGGQNTTTSSSSSSGRFKKKSKGMNKVKKVNELMGKKAINEAMRTRDSADALGDAIRDRADILLEDDIDTTFTSTSPRTSSLESSLKSLGLSLGTSSSGTGSTTTNMENLDSHDAGGVDAATSAVVANYFLKTHGGAHGIQCLASLLAVLFGIGALIVPAPLPLPSISTSSQNLAATSTPPHLPNYLKLKFTKRCLLCALAKHGSGLLAAATLSAQKIPQVGLTATRTTIESLILDPIAQYLFYSSLMLMWTGPIPRVNISDSKSNNVGNSAMHMTPTPWWLTAKPVGKSNTLSKLINPISLILTPILIREIISTTWVISDVLVIIASSTSTPETNSNVKLVLKLGNNIVNAIMSLILGPKVWRMSDAPSKQRMLAKLCGQISLATEVLTGIILAIDSIRAFGEFAFAKSISQRPNLIHILRRIICARLYLNFLLVRRKKIKVLLGNIRGGAAHVPIRILDAMLEPKKAMGIESSGSRMAETTTTNADLFNQHSSSSRDNNTFKKKEPDTW
eukprot:CAMPEP_0184865146 /NCGR_PEP_ID=MMETSP0580-20130426/17112_1 /TAXON_ID=1118495 /ORGANISM="Dactyliosolen fragilissimus" /LENGTH=577 /DNA_ID=CAMNT_0027364227 /DNA_START=230 /DNA_END=1960 /DNA_ORIENTATION=+